jgi:hypothetical protein
VQQRGTSDGWSGTHGRNNTGNFADYFSTAVRTGGPGMGGISLLLIPRGEGVTTKIIKTSYSSSAGTAYVYFEVRQIHRTRSDHSQSELSARFLAGATERESRLQSRRLSGRRSGQRERERPAGVPGLAWRLTERRPRGNPHLSATYNSREGDIGATRTLAECQGSCG